MGTRRELAIRGILRAGRGPVRVVCANGIEWVIHYGVDPELHALADEEVTVCGIPGDVRDSRTGVRLIGPMVDHFRISHLARSIPGAEVVDIEKGRAFTGRLIRTTTADGPCAFVTRDGDCFPLVDVPDGVPIGENTGVGVHAHVVKATGSPSDPPGLWISLVHDAYVGDWRNGRRHGTGTCIWNGGARYVGEWRDDVMSGEGTSWSERRTYSGAWRDGKPHGRGTCIWRDGRVYVGDWRDGHEHGVGTLVRPDGETYFGQWRGGLMAGFGVLTKPDGETYVGERLDSMRHGKGILSTPESRRSGLWEKGALVRSERVSFPDDSFARLLPRQ